MNIKTRNVAIEGWFCIGVAGDHGASIAVQTAAAPRPVRDFVRLAVGALAGATVRDTVGVRALKH